MLVSRDLRSSSEVRFADQIFESEMNKCIREADEAYSKNKYREALQAGFFALQLAKDHYRLLVGGDKGMRMDLVTRFIEVQTIMLAPITPHCSEFVWTLLGKTGSVRFAKWPIAGQVDEVAIEKKEFLFQIIHDFRVKRDNFIKPKKGEGKIPTTAIISVAVGYSKWQEKVLTLSKSFFPSDKDGNVDEKGLTQTLQRDPEIKEIMKQAMHFIASIKEDFKKQGKSALNLQLPFDEKNLIEENSDFIKESLELKKLEVSIFDSQDGKSKIKPGSPSIQYE